MTYDFHIFFIDKFLTYMFSLRICRHSLGNLMTEILNVVDKCKICWNKRFKGSPGARHLTKICSSDWDLTNFQHLPGGGSAWN